MNTFKQNDLKPLLKMLENKGITFLENNERGIKLRLVWQEVKTKELVATNFDYTVSEHFKTDNQVMNCINDCVNATIAKVMDKDTINFYETII